MRARVVSVLVVFGCLPLLTLAVSARSAETVRMWDLVQSPGWDVKVRSVERRVEPLPGVNGGAPVRANGKFAIFVVDLTNRSNRAQAPQPEDFVLGSVEGMRWVNLGATSV